MATPGRVVDVRWNKSLKFVVNFQTSKKYDNKFTCCARATTKVIQSFKLITMALERCTQNIDILSTLMRTATQFSMTWGWKSLSSPALSINRRRRIATRAINVTKIRPPTTAQKTQTNKQKSTCSFHCS